MTYCKDALKLLGKKQTCGKGCPIFENCPRLIMEDASDIAIDQAIRAMVEALKEKKVERKRTN